MKILKTNKYRILSSILKYYFVFIFAFILIIPSAYAVVVGGGDGPGVVGGGIVVNTSIVNPLGPELDTIPAFIKKLIEIVLTIGVPVVTLAIIYTGFLFVKAQGNPEELKTAKKALTYTLIGAALILGAFVIASAIGSTVDEIKSGA